MSIFSAMLVMLLTIIGAVLGRPASFGSGGEPVSLGTPQALLIIVVIVLLALLAGLVIWRARRTSKTRSK